MKSEYKNGKFYLYFPGQWWVILIYLIFTPIYAWWRLGIDASDWLILAIFVFFYLLIGGLFIAIYHPVIAEIDPALRKINISDNYYLWRSVKEYETGRLTKIVLKKITNKRITYQLWGFSDKDECLIGGNFGANEYESAKNVGLKVAELLKIELAEI